MSVKTYRYMGYEIRRGSYVGTTDDRSDRWYIDHPDDKFLDRRGSGYRTLEDAKTQIREFATNE